LPRWLRPQAAFSFDGMQPFKPLPRDQAFSMLESGLNWCVSTQAHHYLVLHAAAVEKNGLAVILPAPPGSGKSTLTAGLVLSGWRLLSDELTLVDRKTGQIQPLPRPISLKNESINVIRQFSTDAYINRASRITTNSMVAHMRPPRESVRRQHETARPGWFVLPKWETDAATQFTPRSQAQALMQVTQAAFTHNDLGEEASRLVSARFDQIPCLDFRYSHLQEAVDAFDQLAHSAQHA
jgi:HprK-related kinase A